MGYDVWWVSRTMQPRIISRGWTDKTMVDQRIPCAPSTDSSSTREEIAEDAGILLPLPTHWQTGVIPQPYTNVLSTQNWCGPWGMMYRMTWQSKTSTISALSTNAIGINCLKWDYDVWWVSRTMQPRIISRGWTDKTMVDQRIPCAPSTDSSSTREEIAEDAGILLPLPTHWQTGVIPQPY